MKIRLSEDEVYEIKMPEEIGIEEFQGIVAKFNFLSKNFTKFNIGGEQEEGIVLPSSAVKKYKKHDKMRWIILKDNKDIFVEILKAHYFKTKEEFDEVCKKHNVGLAKTDMAGGKIALLRELHKLDPKEFGLRRFPSRTEQVATLILPNAFNKNEGETENE